MNMKKKVFEYLTKNPDASTLDLRKEFPQANKKSLWNYSGQWKRNQGIQRTISKDSIRQKVFSFFEKNPEATPAEMRKAFPDANRISISNYRYQWKKLQPKQSKSRRIKSVKDKVFNYLNKYPESTFSQLRQALPEINPSSVSAYHSIWKKTKTATPPPKKEQKARTLEDESLMDRSFSPVSTSWNDSEKELIAALKATIEAQRGTIEVMKSQNEMLQEKHSNVFDDLGNITEEQYDELKKLMSVYVKGLQK